MDKNSSFMKTRVNNGQSQNVLLGQKRTWYPLHWWPMEMSTDAMDERHLQQLRLSPKASDAVARTCNAIIFPLLPFRPNCLLLLLHFHSHIPK